MEMNVDTNGCKSGMSELSLQVSDSLSDWFIHDRLGTAGLSALAIYD